MAGRNTWFFCDHGRSALATSSAKCRGADRAQIGVREQISYLNKCGRNAMEVGKEVPVLPPNRPPKYRQGDIVSVGFEDATSESGIRYRQVVILGSRRAYQVRSIYCLFFPYFLWYFLRVMRVVSVVFRLFPPVFLLPFALRSDPSHFGRSPSVTLILYPFFLMHGMHAERIRI